MMEALLRQVMRGTAVRLCAVVWVFGYILVDLTAAVQGRTFPGAMFVANVPLLLLGIVQSLALGLVFERLADKPAVARVAATATAGVLAALIQTIADHHLLAAIALTVMPRWQTWALDLVPARLFAILILYLWTLYLTLALLWASRSADSAKLNEARAATSAAAAARAEAAALRLQLNPHFMFNTLNGISSLVVQERRDEAEEMIGRLAEFLRASLTADPTALVRLDQEVETARAYLAIERGRIGPRLTVQFAIEPGLEEVEVPNFILQPLVENAVQHGAARVRGPVRIAVGARQHGAESILSVMNQASAPSGDAPHERCMPAHGGHGIGLNNARSRLASQYGARAWLDARPIEGGFCVEIGIPGTAGAQGHLA